MSESDISLGNIALELITIRQHFPFFVLLPPIHIQIKSLGTLSEKARDYRLELPPCPTQ